MTKPHTSAEIRRAFLNYFAGHDHTIVTSASLVPQDDPTLLFTNAGMNQFKDVFLGTGTRPYTRATDTQKCMRVSGKHNDLEEVGFDGTHHTLFEMLGNWSFGDYYKKEAIGWAWDFLTNILNLDQTRLWASVLEDDKGDLGVDKESVNFWQSETDIDPAHIVPFGRKDNFWEMGDTGPCGPCSEIHYDRGPEACDKQGEADHVCEVNGDCARYTEIWNLVFIQYNRSADGALEPLPATHVDTGMGFERLVAILQGTTSNYRTDIFWPIIEKIQALAGHTDAEREAHITAYRVIADHIRSVTFLSGDGVKPANKGRGYVPRMVLRRAVRFGRNLGFTQPFMHQLVDTVVDIMGATFPELPARVDFIKATLLSEEKRFLRTLDQGLSRLDEMMTYCKEQTKTQISGTEAFFLHDTLGLPLEVTRDVAQENGFTVDEAGYGLIREERDGLNDETEAMDIDPHDLLYPMLQDWVNCQECFSLDYDPYGPLSLKTTVAGMIREDSIDTKASEGDTVELVLHTTCFYVESGGQVSDTGRISGPDWEVAVEHTRRPIAGLVIHIGKVVRGAPAVGDPVTAEVNRPRRWDIMRNHTATHLLHRALRDVLGQHIAQAGSQVAPARLRFDYNYDDPLSSDQRAAIERIVTEAVLMNYPVRTHQANYRNALKQGVMAIFEEKYGDVVRVVSVGDANANAGVFSQELCGGTHVSHSGDIGAFIIIAESGIGSGIRRIEAATGRGAQQAWQAMRTQQENVAALLKTPVDELPERVARLQADLRTAHKEIETLNRKLARADFQTLLNEVTDVAGIPVLAAQVAAPDADTLREMADWFRDKMQGGVIVLGSVINGKPLLIAATTKALVKARGVHAGHLVREVAKLVGGGGGGRPDMAQAGGRDAAKLPAALDAVPDLLKGMLK